MPQTLTQIQCPQCKAPTQTAIEQLIDAGKEPAAKARLLSNALNIVQCQVCGYEGQLATPLVYHDQEKELLLTFVPPELAMKKDDQEKAIGKMITALMENLPAEERKAYLLQPVPMFTMQGLMERILEGDGITREQIEDQRARMRIFEQMMNAAEDKLEQIVIENDEQIDSTFLQLANLSIQSIRDQRVREVAAQKLSRALEFSSLGKQIKAQEETLRAAAESLQEEGTELTRERLLEIVIEAPDEERVSAVVSLARPGFDYAFFQLLSDRIDDAEDKDQKRLTALRDQILKQVEEIDEIQKQRLGLVSARLQAIVEAENMDEALQQTLPYVDDLFVSVLQASLQAAVERDDKPTVEKLKEIDRRLGELIRASLPPGLLLAQELLEIQEPDKAREHLEQSADKVDDQLLGGLLSAVQRVEAAGDEEKTNELKELYRLALRLSMRRKMENPQSDS
jgi:hypothetical protein